MEAPIELLGKEVPKIVDLVDPVALRQIGLNTARLGRLLLIHSLALGELAPKASLAANASDATVSQLVGADSAQLDSTPLPSLRTFSSSDQSHLRAAATLELRNISLTQSILFVPVPVGKIDFVIQAEGNTGLMRATLRNCIKSEFSGREIAVPGIFTELNGKSCFKFGTAADSISLSLDGPFEAHARALRRDSQLPARLEIQLRSKDPNTLQTLTFIPLGDYKSSQGDVEVRLSTSAYDQKGRFLSHCAQNPVVLPNHSLVMGNPQPPDYGRSAK